MPSLAPWARTAYGVDRGGERVIVVRATRLRGRIVWQEAPASCLLTDYQSEPKAAWSCGIAPGPGITTWLQTPLHDRHKARKVMASVLDTRLPFPLEECVYLVGDPLSAQQPDLPTGGEGSVALAVAIRRSDLSQQLALLQEKGIDPHILDHEGLALWAGLPAGEHGVIRAILWPSASAVTCVFGMGMHFWGAQRVTGGADAILRALRLLRHTQANGCYKQAPVQWCLGAAVDPSIKESLTRAEPGDILALPDGEYYLARTLAERALRAGPLQFNLRCGPFAHPGQNQQQAKQIVRHVAILATCSLILAGMNGYAVRTRIHLERRLEQDLRSRAARVAGFVVQAAGRDALLIAEREHNARLEGLRLLAVAAELPALATAIAGNVAATDGVLHVLRVGTHAARIEGRISRAEDLAPIAGLLTEAGFKTEPPKIEQHPESIRFTLLANRLEAP